MLVEPAMRPMHESRLNYALIDDFIFLTAYTFTVGVQHVLKQIAPPVCLNFRTFT